MSIIKSFNQAVSNAVNKGGENYTAIFGREDFTPNVSITKSSDFNCGGLANELELLRTAARYTFRSLGINGAESENLEELVTRFIDLPRRSSLEGDDQYRTRFKAISNQRSNLRRTTKWAIMDAVREFGIARVGVIERFDSPRPYFELRVEKTESHEAHFVVDQSYLGHDFIGGTGIGGIIAYIGDIVQRIKAIGVDFDLVFAEPKSIRKSSNALIIRSPS